jgi:regulator of protease activity HflC (stomatin/prohibitin superfamily)
LPPGRYFDLTFGRRSIFHLRRNEQLQLTPPVDVTSSDKLMFRVTATLTYEIVDARLAFENSHLEKLQLAAAAALVKVAGERTLESFLSERAELGERLLPLTGSPISGCEIRAATISAIALPPEVRRLFSEVERARFEGAAALERARGEQASLRSLANAARMLKGNPELMNLRTLQAMSAQGKGQTTLLLAQAPLVPITASGEAPQQES